MTIKELIKMQKDYLAEYNRAVIRRRKQLTHLMANRLKQRLASRSPNNSTTSQSRKLKMKLMNTLHRSVFNNASRPKCMRWRKTHGTWGGQSKNKYWRCTA